MKCGGGGNDGGNNSNSGFLDSSNRNNSQFSNSNTLVDPSSNLELILSIIMSVCEDTSGLQSAHSNSYSDVISYNNSSHGSNSNNSSNMNNSVKSSFSDLSLRNSCKDVVNISTIKTDNTTTSSTSIHAENKSENRNNNKVDNKDLNGNVVNNKITNVTEISTIKHCLPLLSNSASLYCSTALCNLSSIPQCVPVLVQVCTNVLMYLYAYITFESSIIKDSFFSLVLICLFIKSVICC